MACTVMAYDVMSLYRYGPDKYGLYRYDLHSTGLYSYGLYSSGKGGLLCVSGNEVH